MIISTHGILASSRINNIPLLDAYPNASAAYSLRKLRAAYSGNAINVRRSSDNTSLNIGFDSNGNLDTATMLSFVGAGNGYVTTWFDQTTNGYYLLQTAYAEQPQIVSSGSVILDNGKPSVKFTSQKLSNTIPFTSITLSTHSLFYVGYSIGSPLNSSGLISIQSTPIENPEIRYALGNQLASYWNGSYQIVGNYNMDVRKVYTGIINGNKTHTLWGNGTQLAQGSKTGTFNPINELTLGGYRQTNGFQNGYISEFVIYSTDQTSNRTGIENNINTYYNVY